MRGFLGLAALVAVLAALLQAGDGQTDSLAVFGTKVCVCSVCFSLPQMGPSRD